jgi:hypothetical protein
MIAFVIEEMDGRTKFLTLDSIVHGEFSVYENRPFRSLRGFECNRDFSPTGQIQ